MRAIKATKAMRIIKDLRPGDTFVDYGGLQLTVISIAKLPFLSIERTSPKVVMVFKTSSGRMMTQNFRADRTVKVLKK